MLKIKLYYDGRTKDLDYSRIEAKLLCNKHGDMAQWFARLIKLALKEAREQLIKEELDKTRADLLKNDNLMDALIDRNK